MPGDLLLLNARILTLEPARPSARALAARAGRIVVAGSEAQCRRAAPAGATVLDCRGLTATPGFIDAHIHLAAYAASLRAVDCSPAHARSIEVIVKRIHERAADTPAGEWVRAAGYDESALAEGRHPTRWDLDRAAPGHPVRLLHRSGHAAVLNSRALALAGIDIATEEPPGAAIDRRLCDGEPTGLLLEMNEAVARAVPPLPRTELAAGMREAGRRLLAAGVTAVQDLTHTNGRAAAAFLAELAAESGFRPRLLPPAWGWNGAEPPCTDGRGGPVKVMVREAGDRPVPDTGALAQIIAACAARGRQVAVHAVRAETVAAVAAAFERAGGAARTGELRHRIEHAAICPPPLVERIAALGLAVVGNPAFLHYSGQRYHSQIAPADLPHLHALGSLHAAGVAVAAGSDAPVAPPDALAGMAAAVSRGGAAAWTDAGDAAAPRPFPGVALAAGDALALHTSGAAFTARAERRIGRIAPGLRADLTLLSGHPAAPGTCVEMTIIDGEVWWAREQTHTQRRRGPIRP